MTAKQKADLVARLAAGRAKKAGTAQTPSPRRKARPAARQARIRAAWRDF